MPMVEREQKQQDEKCGSAVAPLAAACLTHGSAAGSGSGC